MPTPSPRVDTPPLPPPMQKAPYLKGSPPKATSPPNPTPIVEIPSPRTQKGSSIFSVLDYGAKVDGSSDDTEAMNESKKRATVQLLDKLLCVKIQRMEKQVVTKERL
ncbi:polygalacturonase At1g48100-like [Amaranthus tricolor]|uniref:polygalacturonase At1g48100-like n=1 Tax=Amaranthus tricolor TaxID=29722 RepID=UPI0025880398|nr:polygalacturonase At1g48100-like [Amaranthus tricolor]XP_057530458.1 polygalacturonase At1g48100-like [Amaranthus tricolor]XP_057530459.1 polygalacturonase At1g48100-like [Amaranthus tricolor]XP_057530460.1 polygalacturonase At1g48100-like [Amaranthus tricolor]XP_057530461.1 polygalacturonase At1g48100-like [Amaranthus tricolor]XP_057530462.1 polygalacturonase At1g48100-like [Amaranthus tricolor]